MASRVVTQLISDLSGDEIPDDNGETVEFAYRGTTYRIDLTTKEASGFDKAIATYLKHATKQGSTRQAAKRPGATGGDAKAIRTWAKDQGIAIPDRGRIPADVRARYEAAN